MIKFAALFFVLVLVGCAGVVANEKPEQLPTKLVCVDVDAAHAVAEAWQVDKETVGVVLGNAILTKQCVLLRAPGLVSKKNIVLSYVDIDGDSMELWEIVSPPDSRYFAFVIRLRAPEKAGWSI